MFFGFRLSKRSKSSWMSPSKPGFNSSTALLTALWNTKSNPWRHANNTNPWIRWGLLTGLACKTSDATVLRQSGDQGSSGVACTWTWSTFLSLCLCPSVWSRCRWSWSWAENSDHWIRRSEKEMKNDSGTKNPMKSYGSEHSRAIFTWTA